ncbi:MAG: hypothetical protein R6X06_05665 [Gammaproteobacteria bacterium]
MNMESKGESGGRILDAAADVRDLLRLAHEAVQRLATEIHGDAYDQVTALSRQMHDAREAAEALEQEMTEYVKVIEKS